MTIRFSRPFERGAAAIRQELLADPRLAEREEIPLPTLKQAAKMATLAAGYLKESGEETGFGNRMVLHGAPRRIRTNLSAADAKEMLQTLGNFSVRFLFSRLKEQPEKKAPATWPDVMNAYRAFCTAIVDFLSRPAEDHSPLAKFIGEMLSHPPGREPEPEPQQPEGKNRTEREKVRAPSG